MGKTVSNFFRLYDALIDALAWLCAAALSAVFVLIVVAVTLRAFKLGEPDWILPTTEYAMSYIGTLGAPWLLRERGHVAIDLVRSQLSAGARRVMEKLVAAGCLAFLVLLVGFSVPVLRTMWGEYEMRAYMMPKALLVAPVAVCFALLAIGFLRILIGRAALYDDATNATSGGL